MLDDVVEEFSSRDVFHDHKDVRWGGDDLVQLDDVRMAKELQVLDLTPDLSHHVQRLNLLAVEDFDSHLVARHLVEAH